MTDVFTDWLIVLTTGLLAGVVCRKLDVPLLIGYLVAGVLIGDGGLHWVSRERQELAHLAEAGALLLLFSVGIEFSLDELLRLGRYFVVGGAVQMTLVAIPLALVAKWMGLSWSGSVLAGMAGSLSSTVLVFRALSEEGQSASPHGKRAIGILLFQDVALVPILLLVPLLTGQGAAPDVWSVMRLCGTSALLVLSVWLLRWLMRRWLAAMLLKLRSVALLVLFTVVSVGLACLAAHRLGLPIAIGALAAGLALSGHRLSQQLDTVLLPFRETFAAVFFVTLGMLLHPARFLSEPMLLSGGFAGILLLKTSAATLALRIVGLSWRAAFGMGLGLAQQGEFSFLLVALGAEVGLLSDLDLDRMLFIGLGTLIVTPWLLRQGLRLTDPEEIDASWSLPADADPASHRVIVIGAGPTGRQLASRMETLGIAVCVVDLSPINLHTFAQLGFATVAGDARDADVLQRCGAAQSSLLVICVPDDAVALDILRSVRAGGVTAPVLVRCRYASNAASLLRAGAVEVVSEEAEAAGRLLQSCERWAGEIPNQS